MRRAILVMTLWQFAGVAADEPREFFETRVRPLLAKNCFACHTASRMGGLEMSGRASLLKGGNSGAAIMPGDPARSLMIQAVTHSHERLKMPPQGRLSETEISDLKTWIRDGAVWPESAGAKPAAGEYRITPEQRAFWSFQPVRKAAPPEVKDRTWARGAIDRFVLAAIEKRGLKPVRDADRRTLIRRAYYDLTGLPAAAEEVEAFERDRSPDAFAKVVDRLLASPQYGERWGRYWLDIARYSDDKLDPTGETPLAQAFRYRDWVIQAFNSDMPYDRFIKAQIAGDLMPEKERYQAGLGFYGLRPEFQDDRVDATTRGFLALTVACAQCHDHKFDPIPTQDYYSLQGVFQSTEYFETPIAAVDVVEAWDRKKKEVDEQEAAIKKFLDAQATQLSEILAAKTSQYLRAANDQGTEEGLDKETLDKWKAYLKRPQREHPYLPSKDADQFQAFALGVNAEKKEIDDKNHITLGGSRERRNLTNANLVSLERDKYFLWRDLFGERNGVYWYGDGKIDRFLSGEWKSHLDAMRARLKALKKELPEKYAFVHAIRDSKTPRNIRVQIRGSAENLGPEAPRQFLAILCDTQKPFTHGSGRLELAEGIASASNPLTARVMANRVWLHHFGQGIVRTASNFGQLGERPSHPELLDYLASALVEKEWSIKALHREIMLSRAYALSAGSAEKNFAADPGNRLMWRHTRRRLDAEAIRDSLLWAGGALDLTAGGVAKRMTDENRRRTVYGYVSRKKLDGMLALFDFANPNTTNEQRLTTNVPLQRLFFLNSSFVEAQAKALAGRLNGTDAERISQVYRLLFARKPVPAELKAGLEFLQGAKDTWTEYAQALLSSNEFLFVN
ncbi:MAG: PSD1 and planctomycete cytochrome C domain-containing protein [Bryobacteraceae bacterium]